MVNFQLIEAYDVDIENFNYNVSSMVDSIYIGPQGELLEILERFNNAYGSKIGVTKSFTLKPVAMIKSNRHVIDGYYAMI